MNRAVARRYHRALSLLSFGLLALVAELLGRSLTHRVDVGRHVAHPADVQANYYPFLLAGVKVAIALLLARLVWRLVRARSAARAGRRLLHALGDRPGAVPRIRVTLSPRLWLTFFALTALIHLVQVDAEGLSAGRWPLLAPWLHSSALPVFAVLSVFAALLWSAVSSWLTEYEDYAEATVARARLVANAGVVRAVRPRVNARLLPRRLFGLSFESRPPPLPA